MGFPSYCDKTYKGHYCFLPHGHRGCHKCDLEGSSLVKSWSTKKKKKKHDPYKNFVKIICDEMIRAGSIGFWVRKGDLAYWRKLGYKVVKRRGSK